MTRPDPDRLLKRVLADEETSSRGKLKLFFGANPGVGKTYAMLEAARQRKKEGWDVVVGLVETHGRAETEALLEGLEILPRRKNDYKGLTFEEFDLDAALRRRPRLLIVDELAHTNVAGSRHAKRWQDVEELLEAGIDVYTTLNVQHWETLNDVVAQITGVTVRETVPDTFLQRIHELELVDLAPEDLLTRLKEGKVYKEGLAGRAAEHFFQPGNLIALRELALRHAAERVDAQMQAFKERHAISEVWPVGERLLVGISASPASARLIRAASRMATRLHAEWLAVLVETPGYLKLPDEERARAVNHLRLADKLGAQTQTLSGSNVVDEMVAFARARNVTRIILGKPANPRWKDWLLGSIVDEMARKSRNIDLHIISEVGPDLSDRRPSVESSSPLLGPAARVALIIASAAAVGYALSRAHFLWAVGILAAMGILIDLITARLRLQTAALRERAERLRVLYKLSRELSETPDTKNMFVSGLKELETYYRLPMLLLIPSSSAQLEVAAGDAALFGFTDNEKPVAQWVFEHAQPAGAGSETLSGARGLYVPLKGLKSIIGVLGIHPAGQTTLADPEQLQLLENFASEIGAAVESTRMSEEIGRAEMMLEHQTLAETSAPRPAGLGEALAPERIVLMDGDPAKSEIIRTLLGRLNVPNRRAALRALLDREKAGATVIDGAVALPHARLDGLKELQVALAIVKNNPVKIWVLFLSPAGDPKNHLAFLAGLASFLRNPARIEKLSAQTTPQAVVEFIREAE